MVTSVTSAPRRSSSALVATVVPWHITSGVRPSPASVADPGRRTAPAGSAGVDGTFAIEPSAATTSVNVPPVSTPIRETSTTRGIRRR